MTESPPLVSVLMPVYQAERWLAEALESAFSQTFEDFELVAVDDGSTDRSLEILDEWARRESRLRVVRMPHGGLTRARERSLQEARGRYAAFLDADDRWLPNRLERQLPYADDDTVVFSDTYMADPGEEEWRKWSGVIPRPDIEWPARGIFLELLEANFIPIPTVLAPVRQLLDAGGFRRAEHLGFGDTGGCCDYEMWLALARKGLRFHYVDEPLVIYRLHPEQMSANRFQLGSEYLLVLESFEPEAHGADLVVLQRAKQAQRKRLEVWHRKEAWLRLLGDDRRTARRHLVLSVRARPTALRAWLALVLFYVPPVVHRVALRGTD